jgi:predicted MPP superfamily phosphohydrolase
MTEAVLSRLDRRLQSLHARQRLVIEADHEARALGHGLNLSRDENWYSAPSLIRNTLRLMGLYRRGTQNAENPIVRHNTISSARLPTAFDGFTVLHISDMHVDNNPGAMKRLAALVPDLTYDVCVLTGDFRGATYGPFEPALNGLAKVCARIKRPVFGVLGNHDTIRMVPALEEMGVRMLLNECEPLERAGARVYLAGIDDASFYRLDNIKKAAGDISAGAFSILLSHTPETYRQAAHAGFDLLLAGHTHGGQICLPGSIPITLKAPGLPRRLGSGSWSHERMAGYTSVGVGSALVPVRLNCPPEITLHHLRRPR